MMSQSNNFHCAFPEQWGGAGISYCAQYADEKTEGKRNEVTQPNITSYTQKRKKLIQETMNLHGAEVYISSNMVRQVKS